MPTRKNEYRLLLRRGDKDVVCRVDADSLPIIAICEWTVGNNGYATGSIRGKPVLLHRLILRSGTGEQVDHINGDKLDNRYCNLRIADQRLNSLNRPLRKDNKTGYRGVTFTSKGRYRANITSNKKTTWLGSFDTPEQAAHAYNVAALRLNGEHARLNLLNPAEAA
ncbi:MAG: HNH endonuclease [Chloracidobacterium sp.]|nr:HNH endonuclease [Chloracidobacterium sp.]